MEYHFSIRRFTYAIDEHQNRYELRSFIRGIIGALATLVSIIIARTIDHRLLDKSFLSVLLCSIIIFVVYLMVVFISNYIILILAKHGCKRLFEINQEDNLVNKR